MKVVKITLTSEAYAVLVKESLTGDLGFPDGLETFLTKDLVEHLVRLHSPACILEDLTDNELNEIVSDMCIRINNKLN